jgi:hypothetical protein
VKIETTSQDYPNSNLQSVAKLVALLPIEVLSKIDTIKEHRNDIIVLWTEAGAAEEFMPLVTERWSEIHKYQVARIVLQSNKSFRPMVGTRGPYPPQKGMVE